MCLCQDLRMSNSCKCLISHKTGTPERSEKIEMVSLHKLLFVLCSIALLYRYYCSQLLSPSVIITDPKFRLLGPYNTTKTAVSDSYNQLIDIKNFTFIVNPEVCNYPAGLLLIIIVASNPNNYVNRMIIRNTWGRNLEASKLVFLMGEVKNTPVENPVYNEIYTYNDIVLGSFKDAYRNMTYKHVMGLKWVAHHCPETKYVLKTDDDMLVNSRALWHFLARELSPWGARDLIACQLVENALAQRQNNSKWKVTDQEYPTLYYPTYCAGWTILYSKDVILRLLKAAQSTPYFWIDDVHITGVLAEKIGVARTSINSLVLTDLQTKKLEKLGPNYIGPFLYGPSNLSVDKINNIWRAINK